MLNAKLQNLSETLFYALFSNTKQLGFQALIQIFLS